MLCCYDYLLIIFHSLYCIYFVITCICHAFLIHNFSICKFTICIGKIVETIVFTHAFIVRFFSRLVHLKMPIDKKRYAVAAFAIATAAIIEGRNICKNKRKARGKWTKKWLPRCDKKWLYYSLTSELRLEKENRYQNYLRMTAESFNELLRDKIIKSYTHMRSAISLELQLAINLHRQVTFTDLSCTVNYSINRHALHKKRSFPLKISSVYVTKSTENCGFCHIY